MKKFRSCVTPEGKFKYGIHRPSYISQNLRQDTHLEPLGSDPSNRNIMNEINYPEGDVTVEKADWIFEVPNQFPFRGVTYINKVWADATASDYSKIRLPEGESLSFQQLMSENNIGRNFLQVLPRPLLLTLATCSTDAQDLMEIAEMSCAFEKDADNRITGLKYRENVNGTPKSYIHDHDLYEAVANNPHLPSVYKRAMVLRPGAQGGSEIVGDWPKDDKTHVFEYLRRNSYIGGGHYAANMADDAERYSINDLSKEDMVGLRHLYYQRTFVRLAGLLSLETDSRRSMSESELEELRLKIVDAISNKGIENLATLWGWNFGFDFAPSNYRLHASHQQIHQQYALIPETIQAEPSSETSQGDTMLSFSCGDMVKDLIDDYAAKTNSSFFIDFIDAIKSNTRMDERDDLSSSLVVWEDQNVLVYVPKAQTSQWELQIMTKPDTNGNFIGNILEADSTCRQSLNCALLYSQKALATLGAKMVTSIEFSKRLGELDRLDQPLLYCLLPKLPQSPGAFSEAQLRFINGHYPEDFAAVCRNGVEKCTSE